MTAFFNLLEQLAGLVAPSLVALQSILGVQFIQTPMPTGSWSIYEAKPVKKQFVSIEYRNPSDSSVKSGPLLMLKPRALITLHDLEAQYGQPQVTDLSAHHPEFVGYSLNVRGRDVGFDIQADTGAVLDISINYSKQPIVRAQLSVQPEIQASGLSSG